MPTELKSFADIAKSEVLLPSLPLTQQYLNAFGVRLENGVPVVAHETQQETTATIYFPVDDGNFYLAVCLETFPQTRVVSVRTEVGGYLYLFIQKQTKQAKSPLAIAPTVESEDGFTYRFGQDFPADFNTRLTRFLQFLEPHFTTLARLEEQTKAYIGMAYCGYKEQMGNLRLTKENIKLLASLNLELEIDVYAEGNTLVHPTWGREALGERLLQHSSFFAWNSN